MKLIENKFYCDDKSFQPGLKLTIWIPLELLHDSQQWKDLDLEKEIGKQFLEFLKQVDPNSWPSSLKR